MFYSEWSNRMHKVILYFIIMALPRLVAGQNLLNQPESVEYDSLRNVYLVSNYATGEIVQIDQAGSQSYFSTVLTSTRGLMIRDDQLYAVCDTGVVVFDLAGGNVAWSLNIPEMGFPNDIAADSSGYLYDEEGIDRGKLDFVMRLKNIRRSRIKEYVEKYSETFYTEVDTSLDYNPLWNHNADCAFPSATQNEINEKDAQNLINNGIKLVSEGANMPSTPEAVNIFLDNNILYAPGKAANAGGVFVSGLEMTQNSMRLSWTKEEVDNRLKIIIKSFHQSCLDTSAEYGASGNYLAGANIAGFVKVVNAMLDQGLV